MRKIEKEVVNIETRYVCDAPGCGFETWASDDAARHFLNKHLETKRFEHHVFMKFDSEEVARMYAETQWLRYEIQWEGPGWYIDFGSGLASVDKWAEEYREDIEKDIARLEEVKNWAKSNP